jgi:hypothetical protein
MFGLGADVRERQPPLAARNHRPPVPAGSQKPGQIRRTQP